MIQYGQYNVPTYNEMVNFGVGQPSTELLPLDIIKEGMEKVMEIENHCYLYNELKNQKLFKNDNYPIEFFENMINQVKKVIYA